MKCSKRSTGFYMRCSPEFIQLAELVKGNKSIADLLHEALASYCYKTYTYRGKELTFEQYIDLVHSVGETTSPKHLKKVKEINANTVWDTLAKDYKRKKAKYPL